MSHLYVPMVNTAHKRVPPDPWERVRSLITRLYVDEGMTLPGVMRTMAQVHHHYGTVKQYKGRIKKWGLDKKHKETDMRAIVHQKRQRDAVGKASAFSVRGRPVTAAEVFKYFRRKGVLDPEAEVGAVDVMPEAVRCWTPSPGEESQLEELDANLGGSHGWPLETLQVNEFGTMELISITGADVQLQRTFDTDQMRRLLSLNPEIATFEMPCPLLPPKTLLIPERLLFEIKAYFEGSFPNEEFVSDNQGQLRHISENKGSARRLDEFYALCTTAQILIRRGSALEGRRLLSKVFVIVKDIIREQHPNALNCIFQVILSMLRKKIPEIGTHILKYTSEMATYLLPVTNPWGRILFLIGNMQDSDFQSLLDIAWSCSTSTLHDVYGQLHSHTLVGHINYANGQLKPKAADRLLLGLLQKAEQEMDRLDWRLDYIRWQYGVCLYNQGRYAEVIPIVRMVNESSQIYIDMLGMVASCNYMMDSKHEAEMNMRKGIELWKERFGEDSLERLYYMDTLCGWLHKWGRVEESERLRIEIRDMTELEGIDEI